MQKYGSWILLTLFLALVVQMLVVAPQQVEEDEVLNAVQTSDDDSGPKNVMTGAVLVETRSGQKEWTLKSETASSQSMNDRWDLVGVDVVFYSAEGQPYHVVGDRGAVDVESKDMEVRGDVLLVSPNGYEFKSQLVLYNSEKRVLQVPRDVEMLGPLTNGRRPMQLTGQKMTADLIDNSMIVSENVRATNTFKDERTIVITSDRALFSGQSDAAQFVDNVVMDMDSMRITGPIATFNYDRKSNQVKTVVVEGGVKASDIDKMATASKLYAYLTQDRYVFRGNPKLVQNSDELRGEEIVFLNKGTKVLVQSAKAKVDQNRLQESQ
ncbi:MAG: LPS export ABC transporter periplasmic protein LptC [Bdellovibrionaceae bacterium]|nr:LPS export ABC transporter periplasmic protein LptC [Pseudobdellovibrionaceae bacterium]